MESAAQDAKSGQSERQQKHFYLLWPLSAFQDEEPDP